MATDTERAVSQAKAQLEGIMELVAALETDNDDAREEASQAIREDALSAGAVKSYEILLACGGPAVRIVGNLDVYDEPEDAALQCQDWLTPWTDVATTKEEDAALLRYAKQFYFGV